MSLRGDPVLLFDEEDATDVPSTSSPSGSQGPSYRPKAVPGRAPFHILLPTLSASAKEKYKSFEEWEAEVDEEAEEIVEIEGECHLDGKDYCFARHKDGIVRRVCLSCLLCD